MRDPKNGLLCVSKGLAAKSKRFPVKLKTYHVGLQEAVPLLDFKKVSEMELHGS